MRIVADENLSAEIIAALRTAGYDLWAVAEHRAGSPDADLLIESAIRNSIFVTHDRDFGELIFKRGLEPPLAVLYVRMDLLNHAAITSRLLEVLGGEIEGRFLVIERDRTRQRDLRPMIGRLDG